MRNDSRFFLSSASQMLRKKVCQRCDVLCPLLVQTSFRGVCPGDPGPNEVVSTMESWASENYGTIQKETRNVSWLKWTKLDLFLKKTPVSLLVSPVSEEGKQQRGLYWLLFCGRWVVNGGERIVSYLAVFGVPMQGAIFFLGRRVSMKNWTNTKQRHQIMCLMWTKLFFLLVIRLEVGILRLKSSIDCRSVGAQSHGKNCSVFWNSFRLSAAKDLRVVTLARNSHGFLPFWESCQAS